MRFAGRISAAIDLLREIETRHRPAGHALSEWGRAHRFAGSGDRAAIGNLVYDALRRRASLSWRMQSEQPRALILGLVCFHWGETAESLKGLISSDPYAPDPLTEDEVKRLEDVRLLDEAPLWVQAEIPEWLEASFSENFGDEMVREGQALANRPPVDLRTNSLKSERTKILKALSRFSPKATPLSPLGVRLFPTAKDQRTPNVQLEAGYQKGWFEVQDEASQIASALVFAKEGEQILDYCAGSGGKTLALAAHMNNKGQIFAFDQDRARLAPIYQRLKRAGTRNVQVISPERTDDLKALEQRMDRVVVDAPCTGTGVWRRRADAKWRLTPEALAKRLSEQREILTKASRYVRLGGYLCYLTCSVLAEENEGQVFLFLEEQKGAFELLSAGEVWQELYSDSGSPMKPWSSDNCSLTLTPASTGTDGFYFAVMRRRDED